MFGEILARFRCVPSPTKIGISTMESSKKSMKFDNICFGCKLVHRNTGLKNLLQSGRVLHNSPRCFSDSDLIHFQILNDVFSFWRQRPCLKRERNKVSRGTTALGVASSTISLIILTAASLDGNSTGMVCVIFKCVSLSQK